MKNKERLELAERCRRRIESHNPAFVKNGREIDKELKKEVKWNYSTYC